MNATSQPSDFASERDAVPGWDTPEFLARIETRWHEDLRRFVALGDASSEFLAHLDTSPECQDAVEEALRLEAAGIPGLGRMLAALAEEAPRAAFSPIFDRSRWLALTAAAAIFFAIFLGFVAYQNANIARSDQARIADLGMVNDRLVGERQANEQRVSPLREKALGNPLVRTSQQREIVPERHTKVTPAPSESVTPLRRIAELEGQIAQLTRERDEARVELNASLSLLAESSTVPTPQLVVEAIEPKGGEEAPVPGEQPSVAADEVQRIFSLNIPWSREQWAFAPPYFLAQALVDEHGRLQIVTESLPEGIPYGVRREISLAAERKIVPPSRNPNAPERVALVFSLFSDKPPTAH